MREKATQASGLREAKGGGRVYGAHCPADPSKPRGRIIGPFENVRFP